MELAQLLGVCALTLARDVFQELEELLELALTQLAVGEDPPQGSSDDGLAKTVLTVCSVISRCPPSPATLETNCPRRSPD